MNRTILNLAWQAAARRHDRTLLGALADALEEHEGPSMRSHVIRHGVPVHNMTFSENDPFSAAERRLGMIDPDGTPHLLSGKWVGPGVYDYPVVSHKPNHREEYRVFYTHKHGDIAEGNHAVLYSLHLPGRSLHLVAHVPEEDLKAWLRTLPGRRHHEIPEAPASEPPEPLRTEYPRRLSRDSIPTHIQAVADDPEQSAGWYALADHLNEDGDTPEHAGLAAHALEHAKAIDAEHWYAQHGRHGRSYRNNVTHIAYYPVNGSGGRNNAGGIYANILRRHPSIDGFKALSKFPAVLFNRPQTVHGGGTYPAYVEAHPGNVEALVQGLEAGEAMALRNAVNREYPSEPQQLARTVLRANAGGSIVNNQYQRGGQFLAKARKRIRTVAAKLARYDRDTQNALIAAHGADPKEGEPLLQLADLQQERGEPGVHLLKEAANWLRNGGPSASLLGRSGWRRPIVNNAYVGDADLYHHDTHETVGGDLSHGITPLLRNPDNASSKIPAALSVMHFGTGSTGYSRTAYNVPVFSRKHLRHLTSDLPEEAANRLHAALDPHLPATAKHPFPHKLARQPETPARAKALLGRAYDPGTPLSLGALKRVEKRLGMSGGARLSPKTTQKVAGDEHPFTASAQDIAQFWQDAVRHAAPDLHMVKEEPEAAGVHIMHHLARELQDVHDVTPASGSATEWYGEKVNVLDRALHARYASGRADPFWGTMEKGADGKDQLVGKDNAAEHHPALVLFKALIAATSASQNPKDNLASAAKAYAEGLKRAGSGDPFLHVPHYNEPALKDWKELAAADGVPSPPSGLHERAKWYADHVLGRPDLADKPGYSSIPGKVINAPGTKYHGLLYDIGSNSADRARHVANLNPADRARLAENVRLQKALAAKAGKRLSAAVSIPRLNADGTLRPKGWAVYGEQVEKQIVKLKKLIAHFTRTSKSRLQAYKDAARWLLTPHSYVDFARMAARTGGAKTPNLGFQTKKDLIPGAYLFGPKFGPFMLNLHMNVDDAATKAHFGSYLTADKWFSRTANRYVGELTKTGKSGEAKIRESPRPAQRKVWQAAVRAAAARLGVTPAELQADLWYHEQALWRSLGGEGMESFNFGDAARHVYDHLKLSRAIVALGDLALRRAKRGKTVPLPRLAAALTRAVRCSRIVKLARMTGREHYVYVSPSTREGGTMEDAIADAPQAVALQAHAKRLPGVNDAHSGYGTWSDGAEPAVVACVRDDPDRVAAILGLHYRQKAALSFHADAAGPDTLHILTVPDDDPHRINAAMLRHGIEYKTILPKGGHSLVHVVDTGDALADGIDAYAREAQARGHERIPGSAKLLGAETREQAADAFRQILK